MDEKFSAFLDNEATRDEADSVVNSLLRDETQRASWTRQYWIREALRSSAGDPGVTLDSGFSERVMHAVRGDDSNADVEHPTVVPMARPAHRKRWRTMAGFAVAASAAGLALFVTQPLTRMSDSAPTPGQQTVASVQPQGFGISRDFDIGQGFDGWNNATIASAGMSDTPQMNRSQSLNAGGLRNVASARDFNEEDANQWQVSDPALANRLNGFLVEHNGLARGYGLGATTPGFVRVATYGQVSAR